MLSFRKVIPNLEVGCLRITHPCATLLSPEGLLKNELQIKILLAELVFLLFLVIALAIAPLFFGKTLNENFSGVKIPLEFSGKFQNLDYNVEGGFKVYNQNSQKSFAN